MLCTYCKEPLEPEDIEPKALQPYHRACLFRSIMGSVAHIEHRCGCFIPGSMEGDPEGLTRREAAQAAFKLWREILCKN